jgi:hypothetical protein
VAGALFILNDRMTVLCRTDFLRTEKPDRYLYDVFHGSPDDMRRITLADGYAVSRTCGFGLSTAFVEWSRIGDGVLERSRQQLVDLGDGQVTEVMVPEGPEAYGDIVELRA